MEVNEQRDDAPASISVWFLRRWLAHRDTSFEIPSLALSRSPGQRRLHHPLTVPLPSNNSILTTK